MVSTKATFWTCGLFILLAVFLGSFDAHSEDGVKSEKPLTIAISGDYPPFTVLEPSGEPTGLLVEMWKLWSKATGTPIHFRVSDWQGTLDGLRSGEADIHSGLFRSESRTEWMGFSEAIHEIKTGLFFKTNGTPPQPLQMMGGQSVGTVEGYYQHEYLRENYPDILTKTYPDGQSLVLGLLKGEVDAILNETPAVQADVARFAVRGSVTHGDEIAFSNSLLAGVRKGDGKLLNRINEGFERVSKSELSRLEKLWLPNPEDHFFSDTEGKVTLTPQEEKWLSDHPIIHMAVTTFISPIDIVDSKGNYSGFNADFIELLNQKLGINIVPEFYDKWNDVVNDVIGGKVDAGLSLSRTPERERNVLFTKPYGFDPVIVVVPQVTNNIKTWEDIRDKRIVAVKGMVVVDQIKLTIGNGSLVLVDDEISALKILERNEADAFVGFLLPYGNAQRSRYVSGLRIAVTQNTEDGSFRIGVPKVNPELFGILRKGLRVISRDEITKLRNRWFYPKDVGDVKVEPVVALTAVERQWLKNHPVIRVAPDPDYAPIEFFDIHGRYQGLAADFMGLVAKRVGFQMEALKKENWTAVIEALRSGEVDFIAANSATDEFLKEFIYSDTYFQFYDVIITNSNVGGNIKLKDLSGKEVLVAEGWPEVHYLKDKFPDIKVIEVGTTKEALKKVAFKEYDYAFVYAPTASHFIREEGLPGLRVAGVGGAPVGDAAMFRKDSKVLQGIISKGLASISDEEKRKIRKRWVPLIGQDNIGSVPKIELTDAELSYVETHPELSFGIDTAWPPFEFVDEEGTYGGISSNVTQLVSKISGISMTPEKKLSWSEVLEKAKNGSIQMIAMIQATPERVKFLDFTEPYVSFPSVILTRDDAPFVSGLGSLVGMRTGVEKGYSVEEYIRKEYPNVDLVPGQNTEAVLQGLADGKTDAAVVNLGVATYVIDKLRLSNVKIAAPTEFKIDLAMAVPKGETVLRDILQKSLNAISEDEMTAIKNRWVAVRVNFGLDLKTILIWAIPIGGSAILIIIFVAVWNRKLSEARDEAQAATKSKAAFLAAMSHEIRTPMNGVVGMISLLQETQLESDQRTMMNTVQDSAFSLLQIINDILDFSKIEAGKLSLEKIPVNIDTVMEGVTETLLPNVAKKNLRMSLFIDPDIPEHVLTDQVRLRQILFNLAGNATKFTDNTPERQGVVTLRADLVEPVKDSHANIRLSVIDNGIGMKPEAVDKLFIPFTQADQSTTRKFGGTGLGLSICKTLTELMGGKVSVESIEGKGSSFYATLPFEAGEAAADTIRTFGLSGLRIAYSVKFDDTAECVERYATSGGAQVTRVLAADIIAHTKKQAKCDPLDIFILGSLDEGQDRDEVIATLRNDKNIPDLRFVILTPNRSERQGMVLPDMVVLASAPVRKSAFMHGVAMAAGRASPEIDNEAPKLSADARKAPEVDDARAAGELILVAEDNLTNQDVIRRQLNVLGYACEIADDGMIALDMLKNCSYGMLLTDCHMPNMDGYELTGALRNLELDSEKRLPVVAITANALQGEADRCLASGMDDYLAKPLEMNKLKAMLAKWLPVDHGVAAAPEPETAPAEKTPTEVPNDAIVNVKALTDMFGDDQDMLKEILDEYVPPSRDIIGEIVTAFEAHDAEAVGKAGHKLKSSSRAIGADALADLCAALENAGKGGDWDEVEKLYPDLHPTFDAVVSFIENL